MTPLLWMIALACLSPYVPHLAVMWARYKVPAGYNLVEPRSDHDKLDAWGRRAVAAAQNGFEALPPFLFAAGLCAALHADPTLSNALAGAWLVLRLVYSGLYISGFGAVRTAIWSLAQVCTGALVIVAMVTGHSA